MNDPKLHDHTYMQGIFKLTLPLRKPLAQPIQQKLDHKTYDLLEHTTSQGNSVNMGTKLL